MRHIGIVGMLLVGTLVVGCGKEEEKQVADLPRSSTTPPPSAPATSTKLKYQPQIGTPEPQKKYQSDKPFSGNQKVVPENAPAYKTYVGTVRNVAGNSITVTTNGQDMTFPVMPDIMVSNGNNPRYFPLQGGLAAVRAGSPVRVTTRITNGTEAVTNLVVNPVEGN